MVAEILSCVGDTLPKTAHAGYILCGKEGNDSHDSDSWDLILSISLCQFLRSVTRRRNVLRASASPHSTDTNCHIPLLVISS